MKNKILAGTGLTLLLGVTAAGMPVLAEEVEENVPESPQNGQSDYQVQADAGNELPSEPYTETGITESGLQYINGKYYLFENGQKVVSQFKYVDSENANGLPAGWRYFTSDGSMCTSSVNLSQDGSYTALDYALFDEQGLLCDGLIRTDEGQIIAVSTQDSYQIQLKDQVYTLEDDTNGFEAGVYYLDESGYARIGRFQIQGVSYYTDENGKGVTTTDELTVVDALPGESGKNGKLYACFKDGVAQFGFQEIGGKTYYFWDQEPGWAIYNRSFSDKGRKYFADENNVVSFGFVDFQGDTYYIDKDRGKQTGTLKIDGKTYYTDSNGKILKGRFIKNGVSYYTDPETGEGVTSANGLTVVDALPGENGKDGKLYAIFKDGVAQFGFTTLNGKTYYTWTGEPGWAIYNRTFSDKQRIFFSNADREVVTGLVQDASGNLMYFDETTMIRSSGLKYVNGNYYYFSQSGTQTALKNAYTYVGSNLIGNSGSGMRYFQADGTMATGLVTMSDGSLACFDENGLYTSFVILQNGKLYAYQATSTSQNQVSGAMFTVDENTLFLNGASLEPGTYYFGLDGLMQFGHVQENGTSYYLDPETGKALTGVFTLPAIGSEKGDSKGQITGYFENGIAQFGFQEWNGSTYYFLITEAGWVLKNKESRLDGLYYRFDKNGNLVKGLYTENGNSYYYDPSTGIRQTGLINLEGKYYYFDPSTGKMVKNAMAEVSADQAAGLGAGTRYFDSQGVMATGQTQVPSSSGGTNTYLFNSQGTFGSGLIQNADGTYTGFIQTASGQQSVTKGLIVLTDDYGSFKAGTYYIGANGKLRTGHFYENGTSYYFDADGRGITSESGPTTLAAVAGENALNGKVTLIFKDGVAGMGFQELNGKTYYFWTGEAGYMVHGRDFSDNYRGFYANEDGTILEGGLAVNRKGNTVFYSYETWQKVTGLQEVKPGVYSYFNPSNDGALVKSSWVTVSEANSNGLGAGKRYFTSTGEMATGLKYIGSTTYYFGKDGLFADYLGYKNGSLLALKASQNSQSAVKSGLFVLGESTADFAAGTYMLQNGSLVTGRYYANGTSYYFDENGKGITTEGIVTVAAVSGENSKNGMVSLIFKDGVGQMGFQTVGQKTYYFWSGEAGYLITNRTFSDKQRIFYAQSDGSILYGFRTDSQGNLYYHNEQGIRVSGLTEIDGVYYYFDAGNNGAAKKKVWMTLSSAQSAGLGYGTRYFDENGIMATGEKTISGRVYYFNDKGLFADYIYKNSQGQYVALKGSATSQDYVKNSTVTLDKDVYGVKAGTYFFDSNGVMKKGHFYYNGTIYYFGEDGRGVNSTDVEVLKAVSGEKADSSGNISAYFVNGVAQFGFQRVNGQLLYFWNEEPGYLIKNREYSISGQKYYADANGYAQYGMVTYKDGTTRYHDTNTGIRQTGLIKVDGKYYYFDPNNYGVMITSAYKTLTSSQAAGLGAGKRYFQKDGSMAVGLVKIGSTYSNFNSKGLYEDTIMKLDDGSYVVIKTSSDSQKQVLNSAVEIKTDTLDLKAGTYYIDSNGQLVKGRYYANGVSYYFDETTGRGVTSTDLTTVKAVDGETADADGNVTGFFKNGVAQFKFIEITGSDGVKRTYYLWQNEAGWLIKSREYKDQGRTFAADENGLLVTGWHTVNGKTGYYNISDSNYAVGQKALNMVMTIPTIALQGSGYTNAQYKGTQPDDLKKAAAGTTSSITRYFNASGAVSAGQVTIDGVRYAFSTANGTPVTGTVGNYLYENGKGYTGYKNGVYYTNGATALPSWASLSGNTLYLDPPGAPAMSFNINSKIGKLLMAALPIYGKVTFSSGGRDNPTNLDCIGFVMYCFNQAFGTSINAANVHDFATNKSYGYFINFSQAVAGDVVLFTGTWAPVLTHFTHSSIYLGNGYVMYMGYNGIEFAHYTAIYSEAAGGSAPAYPYRIPV